MRIRAATPADVVRLAPLVQQYWAFESIAGFDQRRIESLLCDLLASPVRGACWLAESSGDLVAYLLLAHVFSLEQGGLMAEIDELFVTPAARSMGVGSQLLERAELDAAARGIVRLQLQLATANGHARTFYEKRGFTSRAGYELLDKALEGSR